MIINERLAVFEYPIGMGLIISNGTWNVMRKFDYWKFYKTSSYGQYVYANQWEDIGYCWRDASGGRFTE